MQIPPALRPILTMLLMLISSTGYSYVLETTLHRPADMSAQVDLLCTHPMQDRHQWINETQTLLAQTSCRAAIWLDSLFGNDLDLSHTQRTNGYLEIAGLESQIDGFKPRIRFRVSMDLPNLKNRVSAFLGRDSEEDFIKGRTEAFGLRSQFPRVNNSDQWLAGLGYALPGSQRLSANLKIGASNLTSPRVFLRGRLHYNLYADNENVLYVSATPFWQTYDGLGITFNGDFSRILTPRLLLRFSEVGTLSARTIGMDWLSAVILYQNLNHARAMAYQLFVRGDTGADIGVFEYGARLLYRHPLIAQKLFLEPTLGYSWPRFDRPTPRQGSYEIGLGIEIPFGQPSAP